MEGVNVYCFLQKIKNKDMLQVSIELTTQAFLTCTAL